MANLSGGDDPTIKGCKCWPNPVPILPVRSLIHASETLNTNGEKEADAMCLRLQDPLKYNTASGGKTSFRE